MNKGLTLLLIGGIYLFLAVAPVQALISGDANNDTKVNLGDIIYLVNYLFKGGPSPVIRFSWDVNANCQTNLSDLIYLVNYVFKGGPVPESWPPWGEPQNLGPPINSVDGALTPCISADGKTLYFTKPGTLGSDDIYYSTWNGTSWIVPAPIPGKVNSVYYEAKPSVTADGKKLFFESFRAGGFGGDDIWMSVWDSTKNEWGEPINLGPNINTLYDDGSPSLTADGKKLYFMSDGWPHGNGRAIWLSTWNGSGWDPPIALNSGVNANGTEDDPNISADGKIMHFIRWNFYGPQIYVSYWENDDWSTAENLGSPVNDTFPSLSPCITFDGLSLYFASYRPGNIGGTDIWVSHRGKSAKTTFENSNNKSRR